LTFYDFHFTNIQCSVSFYAEFDFITFLISTSCVNVQIYCSPHAYCACGLTFSTFFVMILQLNRFANCHSCLRLDIPGPLFFYCLALFLLYLNK